MSLRLSKVHEFLHAAPWEIAGLAIRHVLMSTVAVTGLWRLTEGNRWPLYVVLTALVIFAVGGDTRQRVSTLADSVKFAWRRARVRRTWVSAMYRARLFETVQLEDSAHSLRTTPGGRKVPKLKRWWRGRIRQTPCGMRITVDGTNIGAGTSAFQGDQAVILSARWKARDYSAIPHPQRPYLTQISLVFSDPFEKVITPAQLPMAPKVPTGVVTVGKDSDGEWVTKDITQANLMVGAPGAGKSSECWAIMHELNRQGLPWLAWANDPKGGTELKDLADTAYVYESDATKWCAFLEKVIAGMAAQQAALKAAGMGRRWLPGDLRFPLNVVIIDEFVTVLAMMAGASNVVKINGQRIQVLKAFLVFLSQMRAAGFTVIACAQLSQKEILGAFRDLFAYRTCLRVGSPEMVRTILGDSTTYPAHEIPVGDRHAGIGYMSDLTTGRPVKYRSFYLNDAQRAEVAVGVGAWTKRYRGVAEHLEGMPIELDVSDAELAIDEDEQAMLGELSRVCSNCREEMSDDEVAEHENRILELTGSGRP